MKKLTHLSVITHILEKGFSYVFVNFMSFLHTFVQLEITLPAPVLITHGCVQNGLIVRLLRQVIECLNMKRAIAAIEPTIIAISIQLLKEMMTDFKDEICTTAGNFHKFINELRTAIFAGGKYKVDTSTFSLTWKKFCIQLQSLDFDNKLQHVISKRKGNKVFQFLMSFMRIVGRLFTFTEASRT